MHTETIRRSFLFDAEDEGELSNAMRRITKIMQDDGYENIRFDITRHSTGDYELIALGDTNA